MADAIVNTMEVLETKPITDLVTEVTIKVCWVSDNANPNRTVINREVGKQIAATLPGAPIAGFFNTQTGDFEEHNRRITFKDGEFQVEDVTRPYGFVSPHDNPWYQDFNEGGEVRTYLMCKGYMWTRQYQEANSALDKGQSMELDDNNMAGYYEGDVFVFTEATLDKLCILGDAYAPCFSGANIMANYAKGYNSLAEQIENIIGRRYYVMANQLVLKPGEPITLQYALQLGWDLTDAVYNQLIARGAAEKYWVKGIYAENGTIFAILEDRESLELVRCNLTITAQDQVVLDPEMTAVTMTFAPLGPADPEPVDNLAGSAGIATPDAPAVAQFTATDPAPAPATPPAEFADDDDDKCEDCGNDPCTCDDDEETYKAKYTALLATNAELQANFNRVSEEVGTLNTTIAGLTASLGEFRAQAEAANKAAMEAVIGEYKAMIDEEALTPIVEYSKTKNATAESVEAKCAIAFAKRAKAAPTMFQLNIQELGAPSDVVPDFMKQAMELEADLTDSISLIQG